MSESESEYVLVVRRKPRLKIYLRRYPRDLKEYKETKDFGKIHLNKLKAWEKFSEAAIEKRGETLEDVVENVIRRLRGKKFKKDIDRRVRLDYKDILRLRIKAINKGTNPRWIDILVTNKK